MMSLQKKEEKIQAQKQINSIHEKYDFETKDIFILKTAILKRRGLLHKHPFVKVNYNEDFTCRTYSSTHDEIKSLIFDTEEEVVLVNAIYMNTDKHNFNHQDFRGKIIFTFRLLGISSEWSK